MTTLKLLAMNKTINKLMLILLVMVSSMANAQLVQPEWSKNAVIYEVNIRQYTPEGTFNAFAKELPRLKELGVDILWIMPIHPIGVKNRKGGMGSYYSVKDYTDVAPEYGTKLDFKALVDKAHSLGIKVLIDWVANHSAWDNKWLEHHSDWYVRGKDGEIATQYDWTDVAKLDYTHPEMRTAMIDAMKYWVSDFDIDGYRCDVAFLVPVDFWEQLRAELETIKPVYMLAEMEWNPDINPNPESYFNKAFNASYGWSFMGTSNDFINGKKSLAEFKKELSANYAKFPAHMHKLYFLTNHDENSWNGTVDEKYGKNWQQVGVMVYTLPQSLPLIYTGEEAGLNRRLSFFEKDQIKTTEWANTSRVSWYKRMTKLKHTVPAFSNDNNLGSWKELKMTTKSTAEDVCYAYTRSNGKSEAYVFINFHYNPIVVSTADVNLNILSSGYSVESNANQVLKNNTITLAPHSYIIYYK
jgi:glycosidase